MIKAKNEVFIGLVQENSYLVGWEWTFGEKVSTGRIFPAEGGEWANFQLLEYGTFLPSHPVGKVLHWEDPPSPERHSENSLCRG